MRISASRDGLLERRRCRGVGRRVRPGLGGARDRELARQLPLHRPRRGAHHALELPEQRRIAQRLGIHPEREPWCGHLPPAYDHLRERSGRQTPTATMGPCPTIARSSVSPRSPHRSTRRSRRSPTPRRVAPASSWEPCATTRATALASPTSPTRRGTSSRRSGSARSRQRCTRAGRSAGSRCSTRTGTLAIGQPSVVVAVSAPHRAEAFEAARHGIEELKRDVPIWKKEALTDRRGRLGHGGLRWVESSRSTSAPRARSSTGSATGSCSTSRRWSRCTPVTNDVVAVGEEAWRIIGGGGGEVVGMRPLREGTITEFEVTQRLLEVVIRRSAPGRFPKPRVLITIASGSSPVERRALEEAVTLAGASRSRSSRSPWRRPSAPGSRSRSRSAA